MNNPLPNPLHESFARAIAEGLSLTDAYRRLKPTAKNPTTLGSRLWNRMEIRIRIAEIAEEVTHEQNLPIKRKLELLESQIRGEIPTKVIDRGNGQVEEIFDSLGAISLHTRICGDAVTQKPESPVLKLQFKILGRNEPLTPEMEEDLKILQI